MAKKKEYEITIEMPKLLLRKWLKALRSGKLKQGRGSLIDSENRMCCLGVLQYVAGGEHYSEVEHDGTPSPQWLREHNVAFCGAGYNELTNPSLPSMESKASVLAFGSVPSAASVNDDLTPSGRHRFGFKRIADIIERHARGI